MPFVLKAVLFVLLRFARLFCFFSVRSNLEFGLLIYFFLLFTNMESCYYQALLRTFSVIERYMAAATAISGKINSYPTL